MTDLFDRLREERKRLKMNQTLFAAHGGVTKDTQLNYESGARTPDAAYLERLSEIGVDVLYLITGQRMPVRQHIVTAVENDETTVGSRPVVMLSERHQALIENYDAADETGKRFIEGTADLAAKSKTKAANTRRK